MMPAADDEPPPRAAFGLLDRVADLGPAAQASIPGIYAWAVTVAPAAWARGAPAVAKVLAVLGLASLAFATATERRAPGLSRVVLVWGLSMASALVWAIAPMALAPAKLDPVRAVAGMVGWGLFALAAAAPTLRRIPRAGAVAGEASLRPRAAIPRGDIGFIAVGATLAVALQFVGWRAASPERLLLVRLVEVAAGLAVVGGATAIAMARHVRRAPRPLRARARSAMIWFVMVVLLVFVGLAWAMLR
jgi:hypothetical protein